MFSPFERRHTSTYHQWLFLNETFQHWMQRPESSSDSRLLRVLGAPCSGKTTAILGVYHRLISEPDVMRKNHLVAAFFFEKSGEPLLCDSNGMYRSILSQILRADVRIAGRVLKEYGHVLIKIKRAIGMQGDLKHLQELRFDFRSMLSYALKLSCQYFRRVSILVDALDECSDNEKGEFDTFFVELITSDKFRNLRLCLSLRNFGASYWHWLRPSAVYKPKDGWLEIEVHLENHDAIRTYIDESLKPYRSVIRVLELADTKEKIVKMSQGIFLWASSMVQRLIEDLKKQAGQLKIRQQPIPNGLKKNYRDILLTAEEPSKTFRLLQWIVLAPDLGLNAWRDLMPFLQDKVPRSLKGSTGRARKFRDWTTTLSISVEDDDWVTELRQMICRVSLGLAHVAPFSRTSLEIPIADDHSAAGEAGSWVTADGNEWVVSPVHDSVRHYLQHDGGFSILGVYFQRSHRQEGLMMAMMTCLDFISAKEFSGLNRASNERSTPNSEGSSDSLLSNGDASARTSITSGSISSAWSLRPRNVSDETRSQESESSGGSSTISAEELEEIQMDEANFQIPVLGHLKEEALHSQVPCQDNTKRIRDWLQSLGEAQEDPNTDISSYFQILTRSTTSDTWAPELLAYIMTAFPGFCKAAEQAGVDPMPVIVRLREDGLWARLRCLLEITGNNNSLKHWADSQGLHTWVTYLACTRVNPYRISGPQNSNLLKFTRAKGLDINLEYCLDGGTSLLRLESLGPPQTSSLRSTESRAIDAALIDPEVNENFCNNLRMELWNSISLDTEPGMRKFIPHRTLRSILTEDVLASLLRIRTGLDPSKVHTVRQSYIRVLGILLLMGKVSQIEQMFESEMSDACLPIKVKPQGTKTWDIVSLESRVPGKRKFSMGGMDSRQWDEFENFQWTFSSPFFAKQSGHLQHYKLVSRKQPLPILSFGREKVRRSGLEHDLPERIWFHRDSFDFKEGKVSHIIIR